MGGVQEVFGSQGKELKVGGPGAGMRCRRSAGYLQVCNLAGLLGGSICWCERVHREFPFSEYSGNPENDNSGIGPVSSASGGARPQGWQEGGVLFGPTSAVTLRLPAAKASAARPSIPVGGA